LLDALAELRKQGHDVVLRAVGEFETAEYRQKIDEQIARLNIGRYIHWVGFTQDVAGELDKMDLFILPSLFGEGLPMVILEAMAAGVPIVGTHVEGVPEAIRDNVEGRIAQPNDAADLARVIGEYITGETDWSQLRTNAHRRQAERFSAESMAAGVAEVYQRILDS